MMPLSAAAELFVRLKAELIESDEGDVIRGHVEAGTIRSQLLPETSGETALNYGLKPTNTYYIFLQPFDELVVGDRLRREDGTIFAVRSVRDFGTNRQATIEELTDGTAN